MSQNDTKADLNWRKTNQNKQKWLKRRLQLTQNELEQAKTPQKGN